jgi:hypothetical protein
MSKNKYCNLGVGSLNCKKQLGPAGDDASPNPFNPRIFSHTALRKLD